MTTNATQYTWAGRFSEPVSDLVKRYTASVDFDQRMWRQDIRGSLAHAKMLARQSIISAGDLADIVRGMETVAREIESGQFRMVARPGRCASQHRKAPDRAGRRRRQTPAHRPFAQRPGRHRHPPLPARRDRRHS
jgi:hypothetical protein